MKKTLISALAILTITLSAGFVCAIGDSYVDINMSGTKEITPNAFQLTFAIETQNKDSQKAITENKQKSDALYDTLKSQINTTRGDYIKTSNYSVRPNYDYTKGNKTIKGYTVNNSVIVYSKDVSAVSKFIDTASVKGVTTVDNLVFKSTNTESDCNALLADLTKKAQKRANETVKPVNMQVLALRTLSTSCSETNSSNQIVNYALKSTLADTMGATPTPIEVGKSVLKANINASFYIGKMK